MLHIGTSLLAYGLFGIVTLLAVLILLLNHDLHKKRFSPLVSFLPPLLSLEKLMFQGMWAGFLLLTYSVVSGMFFTEDVFGQPVHFTHKTMFGILSWLIYGGLLLKHGMTAWRGKKAAVWTIVGFEQAAAVGTWLRSRPAPDPARTQQHRTRRPEPLDQGVPGRSGHVRAAPGSESERFGDLQPTLR